MDNGADYITRINIIIITITLFYIAFLQGRERFDLSLKIRQEFIFEGQNLFTGIEWWNKIGNFPYQIRYNVEISQLMYGLSDSPSDPESIATYHIIH